MDASSTKPPRPRRRWLQYSLRTLLVLMLVFGVWLGWKVNKAREQREIVEAIEQAGGRVRYDYQVSGDYRWDEARAAPWPSWLEDTLGRDFLYDAVGVDFSGEPLFIDAALADAGAARDAVSRASKLPELRSLEMCVASAEGLRYVERFTQIQRLKLFLMIAPPYCGNLDRDLAAVSRLKNLRSVQIYSRDLTDAGLVHLESLHNLRRLDIDYSQVTSAGIDRLQAALPECEITW